MIPYEDLVAALANWRTRNGLPTGHADYLGEPPAPTPVSFEAYQERPEIEGEVENEIVDLSDESLEDAVLEEADAPGAEEAAFGVEEAGVTLEDGASDGLAYAGYGAERPDTDAPDGTSAEALFAGDAAPMDGAPEEVPPDYLSEAAEGYAPRDTHDEIPPMADAPDASAQPEEGLFGGQESTEIAEAMDFAAPDEALGAEPPQGDAPPPDATSQMWPTSGPDQRDEAPIAEPPAPGDDPVPIDPDEEPPQP